MNVLKLKYHGTICRLLERIGKEDTATYFHHLKKFAMEVLRREVIS